MAYNCSLKNIIIFRNFLIKIHFEPKIQSMFYIRYTILIHKRHIFFAPFAYEISCARDWLYASRIFLFLPCAKPAYMYIVTYIYIRLWHSAYAHSLYAIHILSLLIDLWNSFYKFAKLLSTLEIIGSRLAYMLSWKTICIYIAV